MKQVESLKTGSEYKQTPIGMIPVDWMVAPIGDVCLVKGGKRLPAGKTFSETRTPYPYIRVVDLQGGTVNKQNLKFLSEDIFKKIQRYTVSKDDIYISIAGTLGLTGTIPSDLDGANLTENAAKLVIKKQEIVSKEFLAFAMSLDRTKLQIEKNKGVLGVPKLALFRIEKILIALPPIEEQKKIAEILTCVDNAIQKTDQIIQKTSQLKKALMQQLLTKGIGHKEFKKTGVGVIPKEWKIKLLKDLAHVDRGKFQHRPRNEPRFYGGKYPFIQTGEVTNSGGRIRKYSQTLNDEGLAISKLFPAGTILVTIAANIGDTAIADFEVATPDSLIGIIAKDEINNEFLEYYLRTRREHLTSLATESAQKNINLETLRPYPVPLPPKEEQIRIVDVLNRFEIYEAIELQSKNNLKKIKTSLIRVLLTGKVRSN